jgi:hypothetical protein
LITDIHDVEINVGDTIVVAHEKALEVGVVTEFGTGYGRYDKSFSYPTIKVMWESGKPSQPMRITKWRFLRLDTLPARS